jgi:hypothetical protein
VNGIKSFTIYEEYYELITLLNQREQEEFLLAIVRYMFEDVEPVLNDRQQKIFNNLKRPLDVSKNKSRNARKENQKEIKSKSNKNQKEIKKEIKRDNTSMMSMSMSMSNIYNNIYFNNKELNSIFIDFLEMRKKLKAVNSDRAINTLINKLNNYDDETKYKMIEQSIENSWKGLFELKKSYQPKKIIDDKPTWLNQDIQPDIATLEEVEEFKKRLASYCE